MCAPSSVNSLIFIFFVCCFKAYLTFFCCATLAGVMCFLFWLGHLLLIQLTLLLETTSNSQLLCTSHSAAFLCNGERSQHPPHCCSCPQHDFALKCSSIWSTTPKTTEKSIFHHRSTISSEIMYKDPLLVGAPPRPPWIEKILIHSL